MVGFFPYVDPKKSSYSHNTAVVRGKKTIGKTDYEHILNPGGGGDSHAERSGILVEKCELNP